MIRLHGFVPFDRSAKVRWTLTELGLSFENRWVDGAKEENSTPEYLKMNPMGRIPVLQINDKAMYESSGICAYLADLHLDKGLAPALTSPERMDYQKWMFLSASTLDSIQPRVMITEDIPSGELQKKKEEELQAELRSAFGAVDQALSKTPFLMGNSLKTPDICIGYNIYWCTLWPELNSVLNEFPRLTDYLERLKKHPSAIKADVFSYKG